MRAQSLYSTHVTIYGLHQSQGDQIKRHSTGEKKPGKVSAFAGY